MTLAMFFSRITLFLGVKHLGGLQTSLIGLGEMLVTIFFALTLLHEHLSLAQWSGALLMSGSILLGVREPSIPTRLAPGSGWLAWLQPKSPEQLVREAMASGNLPPMPAEIHPPGRAAASDPIPFSRHKKNKLYRFRNNFPFQAARILRRFFFSVDLQSLVLYFPSCSHETGWKHAKPFSQYNGFFLRRN